MPTTCSSCMHRVQRVLTNSWHLLPRYCRPVVLPAHSLRSSTTLPSTPSRPPSDPHTIPTSPLTALQANQLIPVSSQLYLGALGGLSDAQLLQQAAIRYAIVISRADEGLSRGEVGVPNLEDLLQWLLTESSRATALGVCTAGGIPCKMIPVQISKQVSPTFACLALTLPVVAVNSCAGTTANCWLLCIPWR